MLADDMGIGDAECYNSDCRIPTPNINAVARDGMMFTDAHAPSAVCTPSRYGLLTGVYCWRSRLKHGVLGGFDAPLISPEMPTLASMLSTQGYRTACVGKWHLGLGWTTLDGRHADWPDKTATKGTPVHNYGWNIDFEKGFSGGPCDLGFDSFFGIASSNNMYPYCFLEDDHTVGIPTEHKDPVRIQQTDAPTVPDWDDYTVGLRLTERAVSVIDDHARNVAGDESPADPLFLYFASEAPHRPCLPAEQFAGKSKAGRRGDMVYAFDWYVGQVVDALKRNGMYENTLLIVTSDNGARPGDEDGETYGHLANGMYRGYKMHVWDGGHRVPFVASWPQAISAGSQNDELLVLTDLLPTMGDLVGAEVPAVDGASRLGTLLPAGSQKHATDDRESGGSVIDHSYYGMFALRRGRWKYVEQLGSGGMVKPGRTIPKGANPDDWMPLLLPETDGPQGQLYDMVEDPQERNNLWIDRPDAVADLHKELLRIRGDDAGPVEESVLPERERPSSWGGG